MVRNRRAALAALSASGLGAALGAQTATAWSATPWIAPEGGIPLLPPGDLGAFRLTGSATRDARLELVTLDPADEPQDAPGTRRALRVRTERVPASPWLIQLTGKTTGAVGRGDAVLVTFFMRTLESAAETDEGRVGVVFEQASDPYTKSLSVTVGTEAGAGWRRYDLPLTTLAGYAAGQAQVNFQLGHGPQTVEIAGVSVLDFGAQTPVASLPRTPLTYAGREADAAWRDEARARIERYRMGDLEVRVVDGAGHPIPAAAVAVSQRRHAFGFGSAVATAQLMAPTADGERYRDHARRNFSKAVLENDLKWPNWEDQTQRARTWQALEWLGDAGIPVRGHTLVWPGWRHMPPDVQRLASDPAALRRRVADHVWQEARSLAGRVVEWDVVNEPFLNRDVQAVLGEGVLAEWFWIARDADPQARLFLNEATRPGFGPAQDHLEATVRGLLDAGAPIGGIGIQCHYGMTVDAPAQLLRGLDRFAQLGLPIQLTEFDIDSTDEALQADYTRDLLLAAFSHPAVDAVLTWGFWEGRHWKPDAALYRQGWEPKPSGTAWTDLVHGGWWTDERGVTGGNGDYRARVFLGEHAVDVRVGERQREAVVRVGAEGAVAELVVSPE